MSLVQAALDCESVPPTVFTPPLVHGRAAATDVIGGPATRPGRPPWASGWPCVRGYDILSLVGAGGMGIVFKARQRDLNRVVALKTLRGVADAETKERFQAEAEAVARLQHPNIIQVFEVRSTETAGDGLANPFIALEYVDGGSLISHIGKPQSPQFAAEMAVKLARAVEAAHRLGVVHRDLKPANVLLTADGQPKIADFGLAKQLDPLTDSAGRFLTQKGIVVGTPEYMAPEQAAGAAVTPAVDIYALGIILYELLTARLPFQAATPFETLELVRTLEADPPRRLQPGVPRDLETICLKCLEKDPGRRYPTADALADDLQRFLDHRPIQARRIGGLGKARRWCRRNPVPAVSLAAVVATVAAAFVLVTASYFQADAARREETWQRRETEARARAERWERYRANLVAAASAGQADNVTSMRLSLEAAPEEFRGWEWRHFHSRLDLASRVMECGACPFSYFDRSADGLRVLRVGEGLARVLDVRTGRTLFTDDGVAPLSDGKIAPDGRTVVFRNRDGRLTVGDVDAGRRRREVLGASSGATWLRIAADSRRVLSMAVGEDAYVWDLHTGAVLLRIPAAQVSVTTLTMSLDGHRLATKLTREPVVRIVDLDTGRVSSRLAAAGFEGVKGHEHDWLSMTFTPTADRVMTAERYPSNTLRLWDTATGKLLHTMAGHRNTVMNIAYSPDGLRAATCSRDQTVRLWDLKTGVGVAELVGHHSWVKTVAFSPDGRRLISASHDRTIRMWDAHTGKPVAVLTGHTGEIDAAYYTADGRTIVSYSFDGTIRTWDARAVEADAVLRGHTSFVYGVAFHPDGRRIVSASWDGTARIWDIASGRELATLRHGPRTLVTSAAFHPDGRTLATRARDGVRLWDVASARELRMWPVPTDLWRDTRLAFSPDGALLAAGCKGGEIRLWETATGAEVVIAGGSGVEFRDVAFSPDGRWLVGASHAVEGHVWVWDVATRTLVQKLPGPAPMTYSLAFRPDGAVLAVGAVGDAVMLWDTATWTELGRLKHASAAYGLAFTPDGRRLACGCADNSIHLWDMETYQEVAELRGHEQYVHQVAFSPDGTRLVSASGDGTVRAWDTVRPQDRAAGR